MEYFWQNIPFFCILLCIASASFTSILPKKAAHGVLIFVVGSVVVMSGMMIYFMRDYNGSYTYMMGHFPAPWGNEIRAGLLEAVTATAFGVIMLLSFLGGLPGLEEHVDGDRHNLYCVMLELLMAALLVQVYTNDMFTAYVFIEIMTLAACALIISRGKGRTMVAGMRYMIMNLMGSGLFLLGLVYMYGITGHLLMEDMHEAIVRIVESGEYSMPLNVAIVLMCMGLAIKSALFPFHTWLADAYGYSTPSAAAVLSSLVSKGYIFLLIKLFYRVIGTEVVAQSGINVLLFAFGLTAIIIGSVLAILQKDIRRMIAYSSVAQIGYIYMGIGMGTEAGMVAAIMHIFVHGAAKSMLFISASGLSDVSGNGREFKALRGSGYRSPVCGVAFAVGAFSMVGMPFLGGFVSKIYFAQAALELTKAQTVLVLLVLAASTSLNTFYFLRTVITLYRPAAQGTDFEKKRIPFVLGLSLTCLVVYNIVLGTLSAPIVAAIRTGLGFFS